MSSLNDLNNRIEELEPSELRCLEKWLDERERRKQGNLKDCFVIMPFSMTKDGRSADYWTTFFEHFLRESLATCGYRARRSVPTAQNIVAGIMEDLAWADLVLAVLTDCNPNVWYELGVRHSLVRGRTVMICRKDDIPQLPFDLKQHGVAPYTDSLDQEAFVDELEKHLAKVGDETHDSPVSRFLDSGLFYCVNRASACLHFTMDMLRQFSGHQDQEPILKEVDRLNQGWRAREVEVTIVCEDKILRHTGKVAVGTPANICWKDVTMNGQSLYALMKSDGRGLRLGSVELYSGRITAIAFDSLPERGWLVVVEAHIKQGGL
jgi:hypothetical protein